MELRIVAAALLLAYPLPALAATITVDPGGGGDFTKIQPALDLAVDGDSVVLARGQHWITETIDFNRLHDPDDPESPPLKNITFASLEGAALTVIRPAPGRAVDPLVSFRSGEGEQTSFAGLTLVGGPGVGLFCSGSSPSILNCALDGSVNGLDCREGAAPKLTNCTIQGNSSSGVFCWKSSPTLSQCTIAGNAFAGIDCWAGSAPSLTNCIVWDNAEGSFRTDNDSNPVVGFCCVDSDPVWEGGTNMNRDPLFCGWGAQAEVWVDGSVAVSGDGNAESPFKSLLTAVQTYSVALAEASPCIATGFLHKDIGADAGRCGAPGAPARLVHVAAGSYSLAGCSFARRVSLQGEGADDTTLEGTVYALRTGSTLSGVKVTLSVREGILVARGESPTIADCEISGSGLDGVRCSVDASPELTNCDIVDSSGKGVSCADGAAPTLVGCRIVGSAKAGVECGEGSSPTLRDCVVSGGGEIGVSCPGGSSATIRNCTITDNARHGVVCELGSATKISNCISWGNLGEAMLVDPLSDSTVVYSCVESDAPLPGAGNLNVDPLFCSEVDFRLQPESPCIRAGEDGLDMGAELGVCGVGGITFRRGDANADGTLNLSDPVFVLNYLFARGTKPPCEKSADSDDSGGINLSDAIWLLNHLFVSGPPPADPFDECGGDPLADELLCESFPACGVGVP